MKGFRFIFGLTTIIVANLALLSCGSPLNPFTDGKSLSQFTSPSNTLASRSVGYTRNDGLGHVLLQGFHWNTGRNAGSGWYNTVNGMAGKIKATGFTMIWLPPPWQDTSSWSGGGRYGGGEGYMWRSQQLTSTYGSATDLSNLVNSLHSNSVKAIFDIVPNHAQRGSNDVWLTQSDANSLYKVTNNIWGEALGYDVFMSGDSDLNLTYNGEAYNGIKYGLQKLRNIGADGFRWDFVHGYPASHVDAWMNSVGGAFSVGENWSTDYNAILNFANNSGSTAFDFILKGSFMASSDASNWGGMNSATFDYDRAKAVTFVDNHDTGYSPGVFNGQGLWPTPDDRKARAYAYILLMPGTPCVYWPDVYDWNIGIDFGALIWQRRNAGINAGSDYDKNGAMWTVYNGPNKATSTAVVKFSLSNSQTDPGAGWTYNDKASNPNLGIRVWYKASGTQHWTDAYFRGTPNSFGATRMVDKGNGIWETTQAFGSGTQEFKIDRYNNWAENYGASAPTAGGNNWSISGWGGNNCNVKITFDDAAHTITCVNLGPISTGTITPTTPPPTNTGNITLQVTKDVGSGNSIYFSGSVPILSNWGGGIQAAWTTGNVWKATVANPNQTFDVKSLKGASNSKGSTWESGGNHTVSSPTNGSTYTLPFNGGF